MELPVRTMLRLSLPTAVVLGALALAWAPDVHAGRKKARKARGDRPRVTGTVEFELLAHDLEDASLPR